jgi:hypothetical protein
VRQIQLFLVTLLVAAAAVLVPASARPQADVIDLSGSVGPGFTISLKDASGVAVSHLDPGAYHITVQNLSDPASGVVHNFHLRGPGGVDVATTSDPGTTTFDLAFVDGTYTYMCDFHPLQMKKTFTVGNAPPPPTVTKLKAKVGPGRTITLRRSSGALVKSLKHGKFKIAVSDASKKDNFHLKGPGVSKKTGVAKRGSVTWTLTLLPGKFSYFSDAHKTLRRTFKVT